MIASPPITGARTLNKSNQHQSVYPLPDKHRRGRAGGGAMSPPDPPIQAAEGRQVGQPKVASSTWGLRGRLC